MRWIQTIPLLFTQVLYLTLGGALFKTMEESEEEDYKEWTLRFYKEFLGNHTCVNRSELVHIIEEVHRQSKRGLFILPGEPGPVRWDFHSAFGFATSLVTTIGYGHLNPATQKGRILVVLYCTLGIPLTMGNFYVIGLKFREVFAKLASKKICSCSLVTKKIVISFALVFLALAVIFFLPAVLFVYMEGWTYAEALYSTFLTISTVGLGDHVPGASREPFDVSARNNYLVGTQVWIMFSMATAVIVIMSIHHLFSKKPPEERSTTQQIHSREQRNNAPKSSDSSTKNANIPRENTSIFGKNYTYNIAGLEDTLTRPKLIGLKQEREMISIVSTGSTILRNDYRQSINDANFYLAKSSVDR